MDFQHIVTIVGVVFASTGFWTFLNSWIERHTRKRSVQDEAIIALLHDKIYYLANRYIKEGSISASEHNNIMRLYRPYVDYGENGTAKVLMEAVDKLPIQEG